MPLFLPKLFSARTIDKYLTDTVALNASSLFTAGEWSSPSLKRIFIPSGVTIGSTAIATPAFDTSSGFGGYLEIYLNGNIDGAGGVPNGGVGGNALKVSSPRVRLFGTGKLRPGGGAGGQGGQGGQGLYYSGRTVTDGPYYSRGGYCYVVTSGNGAGYSGGFYWGGSNPPPGGYSYFASSFAEHLDSFNGQGNLNGTADFYYVYRQYTVYDVPNYTDGGTGGNGGRGQGYDGASASGSGGGTGGTNAGNGGLGGTGGGFGDSGTTGVTGNAGNNSSGNVGMSGGLSGFAIDGIANLENSFSGTTLGRTQ